MPKSSRCSDFQTDHIFARFLLPAFESYRLSDDALWNIGEQFNSQVCRQFRKSSPDQIIEISGMPTDSILLYSRILDDLKASHPEYKQILSYSMKLLIHEHHADCLKSNALISQVTKQYPVDVCIAKSCMPKSTEVVLDLDGSVDYCIKVLTEIIGFLTENSVPKRIKSSPYNLLNAVEKRSRDFLSYSFQDVVPTSATPKCPAQVKRGKITSNCGLTVSNSNTSFQSGWQSMNLNRQVDEDGMSVSSTVIGSVINTEWISK